MGRVVMTATYLTRWNDVIRVPRSVDGDYVFARADADTRFQRVVYVTRDHGAVTGRIVVAVAGLGGLRPAIVLVRRPGRRSADRNPAERYGFSNRYRLHSRRLCGPQSRPSPVS